MKFLHTLYIATAALTFCACQDEGVAGDVDTNTNTTENQQVNNFIREKLTTIYLWADEVKNKQPNPEIDPEVYFKQHLYTPEDQWSSIENNGDGVKANVDGYNNDFGYFLVPYSSNNLYFAQIGYVYPGGSAANAGLKRGDIILKINNTYLNAQNYNQLYTAKTLNLQLAVIKNTIITPLEGTRRLNAQKIAINPVIVNTVLEQEGKKIGYLHYTEFVNNNTTSLNQLTDAIVQLKQAKINELVLDLRYNLGGYITAARHFCSLLAPTEAVKNQELLITKTWNKKYQEFYKNTPSQQEERFDNTGKVLSGNLNLQRIYILCSRNTASASELLISGLKPYIPEIILIGEKTRGKYVAATTFHPQDQEIQEWTINPIIYAYRNSRGESVKGGLTPNYEINEMPNTIQPLGNPEEPLLKTALNLIAGKPVKNVPSVRSGASNFKTIELPETEQKAMLIDNH